MGVLVVQTLENQTTAGLGWNSFGDVVLKRTPVTPDNPRHMSLERRVVRQSIRSQLIVFKRKCIRIQGFEGSRETIKNENTTLEPLNPGTLGPLFAVLLRTGVTFRSCG